MSLPQDKVRLALLEKRMQKQKKIAKAVSQPCSAYIIKSKSSFVPENKSYFAEFVFSDIDKDTDGDAIPLESLYTKIDGMDGDMEHINLYHHDPEMDTKPLFKVLSSFFDGKNLLGKVKFNTNHTQFPLAWEKAAKGEFGISPEYYKMGNAWIISGISGTINPKNRRAKVLSVEVS